MADRLTVGVAARLSRYLQVLTQAKKMGKDRISSQEISDYTNINATQIRRDLSAFGKFGKRGVGYNVDSLVSQIRKILRTQGQHNIMLVGAGRLGEAIVIPNGNVGRCAVTTQNPDSGAPDLDTLKALAAYRGVTETTVGRSSDAIGPALSKAVELASVTRTDSAIEAPLVTFARGDVNVTVASSTTARTRSPSESASSSTPSENRTTRPGFSRPSSIPSPSLSGSSGSWPVGTSSPSRSRSLSVSR